MLRRRYRDILQDLRAVYRVSRYDFRVIRRARNYS